jgi:hypothetical protein
MRIIQNNWSPSKIARITGREPTPEFQTKTFGKFDVLVSEGLDTTIQQQQQFMQLLQLNEALGGMIPKRFILQNATIQGKDELIKVIDAQEQQQAEIQKHQMLIEQAKLEAELQLLQTKSVNELSIARERHGRAEANIGLFEERLSEITQNRSLALKHKVDALEKLLAIIHTYGEDATGEEAQKLQSQNLLQMEEEDRERMEAKRDSDANEFLVKLMQNNSFKNNMGQKQEGQEQQVQQQDARSALL